MNGTFLTNPNYSKPLKTTPNHPKTPTAMKKVFYLNLAVSIALIVGGFILPPTGVIDGSVLTAVGLLLMFGVIAQIPDILDAVRNGKSIKLQKGDMSVDISANEANEQN